MEIIQNFIGVDWKYVTFLFVIMGVDIITGIMKAIKNNNLITKTAWIGYAKKIGVFCIIIVASVIDQILGLKGAMTYTTVLFYIATEGLSIVENLAQMGVSMPNNILNKLKVMQEENNKEKEPHS